MPSPVVLVVDDDDTVVTVLSEFLDGDYEIVAAANGELALRELERRAPEVVFTDIRMPGMDGLEFLDRARQVEPDVPVILMTGHKTTDNLERAVSLGAFEFLDKPFSLDAVEAAFRRAVRRRRQLRRRRKIEALARDINRVGGLDELLDHLRHELPNLVGVRLFSLFLFDPDRERLDIAVSNHLPMAEITPLPLADLDGPMRRAVKSRRAAFIEEGERSRWARGGQPRPRYLDDTSATLPLLVRDKLIGVLNLNDKVAGPSQFDADDVAFLSIAAEHIASAIAVRLETARLTRALTELRETQERLIQSEKLAALTKLVAGIAHELKNPLTSLHLCTVNLDNLYRRQGLDDEERPERQFIQSLHQDINRLQEKVGRFLAFARPERVERRRSSPLELAHSAIDQVGERLRASGIGLQLNDGDGIPDVVVDRAGFIEAVVNLLVNAIEAIPDPATGRIVVSVRREDRGLRLEVSDNGCGIPDDAMAKICDVFFTTKEEGSGIGLSQVHLFCHVHGGRLAFESRPGETTFRIHLPGEGSR